MSDPIDDYINAYPPAVQTILRRVRATIAKAAPDATEQISYRMPTFMQDGPVVYFGGFKEHVGLYPPVRDAALKREVAAYANDKGSLAFRYDEPIPYALIAKVVQARVAENVARTVAKKVAQKTAKKSAKKSAK